MENKIINFYRQIVFGRRFKNDLKLTNNNQKQKTQIIEEIKLVCFITAWNDMSRHQKNINNSYKFIAKEVNVALQFNSKKEITNRDEIIIEVFKSVKDTLSQINSKNAIEYMYNLYGKDKIACGLEYGKAQKIVNMYYKYLYTFCFNGASVIPYFNLRETDFKNCDCPIDNYILDAMVAKKLLDGKERKKIVWSNMDELTYNNLQQTILKFIKENANQYKMPLDFDFENFG